MATSELIQSSTAELGGKHCPGCSPCSDDGSYTAAGHYCVDCGLYFCGRCLKCHNKIPASASHQVNAVANVDSDAPPFANATDDTRPPRSTRQPKSLKCPLHHGQCIDTYCEDCDAVCCTTCAIIKHSTCTTEDISTAAKDFKSSSALNKSKDALNDFITRLKEQKERRTNNLRDIEEEKLECIEAVDAYEEEAIAKIKKLADNSRQAIRSKYEEHKTVIERDVCSIDTVETSIRTYIEKQDTIELEQLLFAVVKTSKIALDDGEQFLEYITDQKDRTIIFDIDNGLRNTLSKLECIGQLGNDFIVEKFSASFLQNVEVDNDGECIAGDVCVMRNGDIIVATESPNKLKRFSSDLELIDEIELPNESTAVCEISEHEVAVRERSTRTVHIVSVGETMEITSELTLDNDGYGMVYDASTSELFACEKDKVSVYSKTGQKIRTYDTDSNGEQIFSACRQVALSKKEQDIYVTDLNKGLIVLKQDGTLKMKVDLAGMIRNVWPLCILPGNICLVGGEQSKMFMQIDKHGNSLSKIIDRTCAGEYLYSVTYDRDNERLIVGADENHLLIYKLSPTE